MFIATDKRERAVLECAPVHADGAMFRAEHLTVGDFIFIHPEHGALCVVERKTWADLAASIKDARISNIEKLKTYREETGARIVYLIEGNMIVNRESRVGNIAFKSLRAHLDHLIFRDCIIELRSKNAYDTMTRLAEFGRNILTIAGFKPAAPKGPRTADQILGHARQNRAPNEAQLRAGLWRCVPMISERSAPLFVNYAIADLFAGRMKADEIAAWTLPGGGAARIGAARAAKICAVSTFTDAGVHAKILAAIPSISDSTAKIILSSFTFRDIICRWAECKTQIAALKRGKKAAVGERTCDLIEKFLFSGRASEEE